MINPFIHRSIPLVALFMFLLLSSVSRLLAQPLSFEAANKLYDEGRFPDAATAYEKLIMAGKTSATVYFNMGNALFKSGQVGRAIAAYRTAEQLAPRDPDIRANLRFARNQVQPPTMAPNPLPASLERLTLNEWTMLAAAAFWTFFVLLATGQLRPEVKRLLRPYVFVSLVAGLLLAASLAYCYYDERVVKIVIVAVPDAIVRQRPLDGSPNAFTIHDGAEMRLLDRRENWLQVTPDPSRIGWIQQDNTVLFP
jgi:tetratricopeptide (TPR) repeat protein